VIIMLKTLTKRRLGLWSQALLVVLVLSPLVQQKGYAQQPLASVDHNYTDAPGAKRPAAGSLGSTLTAVPEDFSKITLAPGYLLQLDVYNTPEMSVTLRVDQKGDISVPLVGAVHVAGETVPVAQDAIAKALIKEQILNSPQVTLNVLQYSSENVTLLGEVQSPGRVQLLAPKSLPDLLALAGGETTAAGNNIEIRRAASGGGQSQHISYAQGSSPDAIRDVMVNPGDTVFVHRAGIVYVLGAVNRPGGYLMINGGAINVAQALALAQGTSVLAATGSMRILRRSAGTVIEMAVSYPKVTRGETAPVMLEENDIVYVPVSKMKSILTSGSSILSSAASAAIYSGLQ
jgi:polysaccharide export outer membrane protein